MLESRKAGVGGGVSGRQCLCKVTRRNVRVLTHSVIVGWLKRIENFLIPDKYTRSHTLAFIQKVQRHVMSLDKLYTHRIRRTNSLGLPRGYCRIAAR